MSTIPTQQQNNPIPIKPGQIAPRQINEGQPELTPRDGSSLYYALLYTPELQSRGIVALLDLSKTLAETLEEVTDASVAEKKIHWWHEEITRLYDGAPRHPSTQAAVKTIQTFGIDQSFLWSILEANNNGRFINSDSDETYQERLLKDYGARLSMCAQVLQTISTTDLLESKNSDPLTDNLLVNGLGTFDLLCRFRHLRHRGYLVFPDSDYKAEGLDPDMDAADPKKHLGLLTRRISYAKEQLDLALDSCVVNTSTLPLFILASLRAAQLSNWQRSNLRPDEKYMTLTPLRKTWLAWRFKQRHQRNL